MTKRELIESTSVSIVEDAQHRVFNQVWGEVKATFEKWAAPNSNKTVEIRAGMGMVSLDVGEITNSYLIGSVGWQYGWDNEEDPEIYAPLIEVLDWAAGVSAACGNGCPDCYVENLKINS